MATAKKQIVNGQLECSKCGQWKSINDFNKAKETSFGRRSRCRTCEGRVQPVGVFGRRPIEPVDGQFQCLVCREWKPLERFEKQAASAYGRTRRCYECCIRRSQEHDSRSPKNFLAMLARSTKRASRQRGKRRGPDFSMDALDTIFLMELFDRQAGRCAVTGLTMTHQRDIGRFSENISIDRLDSTKGYERNNIRLVCAAVNLMRQEMTDDELRLWANRIIHPI
jgi:hypothetical protein